MIFYILIGIIIGCIITAVVCLILKRYFGKKVIDKNEEDDDESVEHMKAIRNTVTRDMPEDYPNQYHNDSLLESTPIIKKGIQMKVINGKNKDRFLQYFYIGSDGTNSLPVSKLALSSEALTDTILDLHIRDPLFLESFYNADNYDSSVSSFGNLINVVFITNDSKNDFLELEKEVDGYSLKTRRLTDDGSYLYVKIGGDNKIYFGNKDGDDDDILLFDIVYVDGN